MAVEMNRFGVFDSMKRHWDVTPHDLPPVELQSAHISMLQSRLLSAGGLASPGWGANSIIDYSYSNGGNYTSVQTRSLESISTACSPTACSALRAPFELRAPSGFPATLELPNRLELQSPLGPARIVMPRLVEGGKLGLAIKDLEVLSLLHPGAASFGWCVGDRVLSVNGHHVHTQNEFGVAFQAAMESYNSSGTPLVFEVARGEAADSPTGRRHCVREGGKDPCCGGGDEVGALPPPDRCSQDVHLYHPESGLPTGFDKELSRRRRSGVCF